jgi:hypothetical protein
MSYLNIIVIENLIIMSAIEKKFAQKASDYSDIHEHLVTLYRYALKCSHITECGVRDAVSSYAFASALKYSKENKLIQVDPYKSDTLNVFMDECARENVNVVFHNQSDLECPLEPTELLFIDTWHVYGQLKRELARWNTSVSKYIIMHDTTVDEWFGETIRMGCNSLRQSKETGIPVDEIEKGLWPAISEFLNDHPEWTIRERFTNNNGLTVLERV